MHDRAADRALSAALARGIDAFIQGGMSMKPTIGRIVHYVAGGTETVDPPAMHYPAVVTHVWSDTCVNLDVWRKGWERDAADAGVKTSVTFDPTGSAGYTWHWPEREGA